MTHKERIKSIEEYVYDENQRYMELGRDDFYYLLNRVRVLTDLLERCQERLDDSDPSDELYCQVNEALEGEE